MSSALVKTKCSRLWCCQRTVIRNNRSVIHTLEENHNTAVALLYRCGQRKVNQALKGDVGCTARRTAVFMNIGKAITLEFFFFLYSVHKWTVYKLCEYCIWS
jgi:hypothetical protein